MYWANFLHIYQPPTQKKKWVVKIAEESYRKLTHGLLLHPTAKMTLNVNAVLLELLDQYDCDDVISDLRTLGERGQIEFTASAKYHPFLPLMPEREIRRQIALNTETCTRYLGDAYQPKGFFSPEMAYARRVADIVSSLGYQWMILDELAFQHTLGHLSPTTVYVINGLDSFFVFFRDRATSLRILSADIHLGVLSGVLSSSMLVNVLGKRLSSAEYLLTAMDGETFGHHRPGLEKLLFDFYAAPGVQSVHISELPSLFPERKTVEPLPSTWALMKKDIERNVPYSRWKSEENEIQLWQWELTDLAIEHVERLEDQQQVSAEQRAALDRAIHSDQYWWASAQPWWSIEMIEVGAKELRDVLLSLPVAPEVKERAQALYAQILFRAFDWQRSGKVDILSSQADEDVTQRITTELPYIPREELDSIVKNLLQQMQVAADAREYERAAQIRNRVQELEAKRAELTTPHDTVGETERVDEASLTQSF